MRLVGLGLCVAPLLVNLRSVKSADAEAKSECRWFVIANGASMTLQWLLPALALAAA